MQDPLPRTGRRRRKVGKVINSLSIARTFEKADIRTTQALHAKLRREEKRREEKRREEKRREEKRREEKRREEKKREEHVVRKDLGNTRANQFHQEAITSGSKSMTTLKAKIKSEINADQSKA